MCYLFNGTQWEQYLTVTLSPCYNWQTSAFKGSTFQLTPNEMPSGPVVRLYGLWAAGCWIEAGYR